MKNRQIQEALDRMHRLNLPKDAIEAFMGKEEIMCSRSFLIGTKAVSRISSINDEVTHSADKTDTRILLDAIDHLKRIDSHAMPYHAVFAVMRTEKADMLICNLLFVSSYPSDWHKETVYTVEKNGIAIHSAYCLAYNGTIPEFSDLGTCSFIQPTGEGLVRIS